MDRGLAVALTAFVGGLIALQAPVNSLLGRATGTIQATFVTFFLGTAVLAVLVAFVRGGYGQIAEVRHVPWYALTGGFLGLAYVTAVLVTVRTLGAGGVTAATIAGQLTMSVIVDHQGWLGVERSPVTAAKVTGLVLLAAGTWLVVRE
jgi:bacterial/archaeal transporter family-2 protein